MCTVAPAAFVAYSICAITCEVIQNTKYVLGGSASEWDSECVLSKIVQIITSIQRQYVCNIFCWTQQIDQIGKFVQLFTQVASYLYSVDEIDIVLKLNENGSQLEQFESTFISGIFGQYVFFHTIKFPVIHNYPICRHRNIPKFLVILSSNRLGFALFLIGVHNCILILTYNTKWPLDGGNKRNTWKQMNSWTL